ncbi:MAG: 3-deoxy-D-manno-octulosonic acid kinase [Steroidobacteraceae bacterium]
MTAQPLTLRRLATTGSAGEGAIFTNAACGFDVPVSWFEPRYWIAQGALVGSARGRGATQFFEHEGRRYALRHYRRGGLVAKLSADQYLWLGEGATRPLRELQLTMRMHAAGLPVPVAVAARYIHEGWGYSGDIITELLPDTLTLAQRLDAGDLGLVTWAAIGRCIRRFHDQGYWHPDLNAHNVLLRGESEVFLIDFDRGRRRRPGWWRDANLTRLLRSLEKLDDARPVRRLDAAQWQCLLAAYQPDAAVPGLPPA